MYYLKAKPKIIIKREYQVNFMNKKSIDHPYLVCILVFVICCIARVFEYYCLRTDETIISENIFHKLFGIAVLLITLKKFDLSMNQIGFIASKILNTAKGLLLGAFCFSISYSVEMGVLFLQHKNPSLDFYAGSFSMDDGGEIKQRAIGLILLCVLFNIVNVIMEEGVFRGLYLNLTEPASGFVKANFFAAFLFGIWHWVMPLRSYTDGDSSLTNLIVMGIGYVILAGIMGIKWGMLYKMSGCLWIGLGDHLFNNLIATNLVHVVADNEADNMQIIRIVIAQLLSFAIVNCIYKKHKKKEEN